MVSRRGFLGACLALAAAPAIVRADSLMRIVPRETTLIHSAHLNGRLVGFADTQEGARLLLRQECARLLGSLYLPNLNEQREMPAPHGGTVHVRRPQRFLVATKPAPFADFVHREVL